MPVSVDAENHVYVDDELIGRLEGFTFHVDPAARVGERKLLLAAAERHLASYLKDKARAVAMAETEEFALGSDGDGRPALLWNGAVLGHLAKGRTLLQPLFKPVRAVAGLEGNDLRAIAEKAEGWIQQQLAKHMGGLIALNQLATDAATDGVVRALAARLADAGGIAGRQFLADTLTALPKEARGAARKAGIVFGALDVYHHGVLKPAAAKWRAALFSAMGDTPMPDLPPESAVHLKDWNFASIADCRNAGYRRVGNEYVRIDLAERVIKRAHEARGAALEFEMDMAFATSLGLSEGGLEALMRDAGFNKGKAKVDGTPTVPADPVSMVHVDEASAEIEADAVVSDDVTVTSEVPTESAGAAQAVNLTYWRWVGLRKAKPLMQRPDRPKNKGKPKIQPKQQSAAPRPKPELAAPSALALQLAALKEKMGS